MNELAAQQQTLRRSAKSAAAFRTISEVASELDVPSHVLRFWETKFVQVRPLKRGGGRRYYRPEDVDLLRRIQSLLYDDGYTIKGVQKLMREGGMKVPEDPPQRSPEPPVDPPAETRAAANGAGLDAATRGELQAVLAELEALRDLLDGDGK